MGYERCVCCCTTPPTVQPPVNWRAHCRAGQPCVGNGAPYAPAAHAPQEPQHSRLCLIRARTVRGRWRVHREDFRAWMCGPGRSGRRCQYLPTQPIVAAYASDARDSLRVRHFPVSESSQPPNGVRGLRGQVRTASPPDCARSAAVVRFASHEHASASSREGLCVASPSFAAVQPQSSAAPSPSPRLPPPPRPLRPRPRSRSLTSPGSGP